MYSPKLDLSTTKIFGECDRDIFEAMSLIGQEVYMSDDEDFRDYYKCTLVGSRKIKDESLCYIGISPKNRCSIGFKYFILAEYAVFAEEEKAKEKKLRPFKSMREFFDETGFDIGDVVQIRRFGAYTYEEKSIFNGFRVFIDEESHNISVIFGSCSHSFKDLHQNFEYQKNNKWLPFGVEDDE